MGNTQAGNGPVRANVAAGDREDSKRNAPKRSLKQRTSHEAKRLVAMFLYLWVLFGLFALHESIVLAKHDIDYSAYGFAVINAWLLAKVMLVAEDLRLAHRFEDRPLIYPIIYRSMVFAVVFIGFDIVEHVLLGWWRGKTIVESFPAIGGGTLTGILSVAAIISVALMPFFAFRELGRVIGEGELRALLFTRGAATNAKVS
jgi:hypothetical protein